MHRLLCVAPADIEAAWPIAAPMIDAAYAALDEPMPEDLLPWLMAGKGFLWVLIDRETKIIAAGTTSLIRGRAGLVCRAVTCGGSGGDWETVITEIERYARAEGCYKVKVDGRRGWGRVLPGYDPVCVTFEKRI